MRRIRRPSYPLVAILAVQLVWCLGLLWRSSVVVEGQRVFCLFDDAMISMRYARNWAGGLGLVWNAGERVEGYTNFLWTAVMAGVHALGWSGSAACLAMQLLGIGCVLWCSIETWRLARFAGLWSHARFYAVLMTALQYNLAYFGVMGMETAFLTALLTRGLTTLLRLPSHSIGHSQPRALGAAVWFVPAALTRLDALAFIGVALAERMFRTRDRRVRIATGIVGLIVAAATAAHFLWRHAYYGEWLPNTYVLKATGWPLLQRLDVGLQQGLWTAATLGVPSLLALFAFALRSARLLPLIAPFVVLCAYQTYVGGDAWPLNRFVLPATPALFVAAAYGIDRITRRLRPTKKLAHRRHARFSISALAGPALLAACVLGMDGVHWNHVLLISAPQTVGDNLMNLRLARLVDRFAARDATVAVAWAGAVPYFTQRVCHDMLGKCDPYIARLPALAHVRRAGHNKYDLQWSLTQRKPDVLLHAFRPNVQAFVSDYQPFRVEIDQIELVLYVRRGSTKFTGGWPIDLKQAERIYNGTEAARMRE